MQFTTGTITAGVMEIARKGKSGKPSRSNKPPVVESSLSHSDLHAAAGCLETTVNTVFMLLVTQKQSEVKRSETEQSIRATRINDVRYEFTYTCDSTCGHFDLLTSLFVWMEWGKNVYCQCDRVVAVQRGDMILLCAINALKGLILADTALSSSSSSDGSSSISNIFTPEFAWESRYMTAGLCVAFETTEHSVFGVSVFQRQLMVAVGQ